MTRVCIENSRRLTGANLFSMQTGAVLDLLAEDATLTNFKTAWENQASKLLSAIGWSQENTFHRLYEGGISLGLTAPIDCLYSAAELAEAAVLLAGKELGVENITGIELESATGFDSLAQYLQELIVDEQNPALLKLAAAAESNNVLFLFDDDLVSLGSGPTCQKWKVDELPAVKDLVWSSYKTIPLALITGTNGKSTSVRLASAIAEAASMQVGSTSTDYIKVGNNIIDKGDYSGPGGARTLLRDKRVEIAFLELARGGLLRRGLGVPEADTALITNVAADHLGDYGINSVAELRQAKFIVQKALKPTSPLVLNADDEGVVEFASNLKQNIIWFAENFNNQTLVNHLNDKGEAISVLEDDIVHFKAEKRTRIVNIKDIPLTLGGHARHNVQNVLGVCGICCALGIGYEAIRQGLLGFRSDATQNPGRGNFYEARGVKVLVDFAHNEHGMQALASTASSITSKRRLILMGQAGDRSDESIIDMVNAAMQAQPDHLIASETPGYERGREAHETADVIAATALARGLSKDCITRSNNPTEGIKKALDWAQAGDLLLLFVLTNRDESIRVVEDYVKSATD
ncbi:MAG: Mur ligase [Gammaproteobacteria bacterium]|nr:Mur ligase [Gammaproteobacteria bacterium]